MPTFRDRPIGQKLVWIIMATTAAALLLAGSCVVLADAVLFQRHLRRDLVTLARMIADNSTAALVFDDPKAAAETMGALRERTHVIGACINRPAGNAFAVYSREGPFRCPPAANWERVEFTREGVIVSEPIVLTGQRIG